MKMTPMTLTSGMNLELHETSKTVRGPCLGDPFAAGVSTTFEGGCRVRVSDLGQSVVGCAWQRVALGALGHVNPRPLNPINYPKSELPVCERIKILQT